MGGLFGIVSKENCSSNLFYGTDYHTHMGSNHAGISFINSERKIQNIDYSIKNSSFQSEFKDILNLNMNKGIGIISDNIKQPLKLNSRLGEYSIAFVGKINNSNKIQDDYINKGGHLVEINNKGEPNPTEIVATLLNQYNNFKDGIQGVQNIIKGSCSMLILTNKGIYAARDKLGRTPLILGRNKNSYAITSETTAFQNSDLEDEILYENDLGPGEIVFITNEGVNEIKKPNKKMQICSFLWVYYGFPSSNYEGINVEVARNRSGQLLAINDNDADIVGAIPDSGNAYALGYSEKIKLPLRTPLKKYTPTWGRSFTPPEQKERESTAKRKLTCVKEYIKNKKIVLLDDSIVRGTQINQPINKLYSNGAKKVHVRIGSPPLFFPCEFIDFSRSEKETELTTRRAIFRLTGKTNLSKKEVKDIMNKYSDEVVDEIRKEIGVDSLKYQNIDNLVKAIGLPKEKLCTHCFDGSSYF